MRGAGTPRRRGSAASVPPSAVPAGAAAALCRQRALLDGSVAGPGLLTPPSSRPLEEASHGEGRAGGGFRPPLARRAAGWRAQIGGRPMPCSARGRQGERPPIAPLPESRAAGGGMQQGLWLPPQLIEAVRVPWV